MPIPTVFRPVRSNDVQLRPFKAYKSYTINSDSEYSSSGYRVHNALHNIYAIHVGDDSYSYPTNAIDDTNQHVIWKGINHRYYQYPFDATRCHELTNNRVTEKYLHYSASILTLPYFDVGEQIKPGSVTMYGTPVNTQITLNDDGTGNLRDALISTSSFASSSNLMFYMSFNDEYRKFESQFGNIATGSIKYILDKQELTANCLNVEITGGVLDSNNVTSGIASGHSNVSYINVPHHKLFDKFNKTDHWSVSFWYYIDSLTIANNTGVSILSKYASIEETYVPTNTKVRTTRTRNLTIPSYTSNTTSWNSLRTPMHIELVSGSSNVLQFIASNGSNSTVLSGSWGNLQAWHHCVIVNNSTNVKMYIDNTLVDTDILPIGTTSNLANLIIGNHNTVNSLNFPFKLDEIRFYDYAVTETEIASLNNNHYLSGSLYQTNVAGNVFYRNGQVVVSSPLPKYNSGSGFFNNDWTASWKGTHTIYENEVMVRIPSDQFNYTMNPTATYRPASTVDSTSDIEKYNGTGDLFKSMFTSSFVSPYITTVGLYNNNAQLLAVGKLAQPIQKRDDIDMNIIVRWDY